MRKSFLHGLLRLTTLGLNKGPHILRYSMYQQLASYQYQRSPDERALSISGSQFLAGLLGFLPEQIMDVQYPEYNMLHLPFPDQSFEAVFSDQVLEHLEGDPQEAINESFRVLKPGGLALHTTCLMNTIHGAPGDYWRFTPDGLRLLTSKQSEVLDAGGWGNPYIWFYIWCGMIMEPVPNTRWHPFHWLATYNRPNWPFVTWVLARKKPVSPAV